MWEQGCWNEREVDCLTLFCIICTVLKLQVDICARGLQAQLYCYDDCCCSWRHEDYTLETLEQKQIFFSTRLFFWQYKSQHKENHIIVPWTCMDHLHWLPNMASIQIFSKLMMEHVLAAMLGSRAMGKSYQRLWRWLMCTEMHTSVLLFSCWMNLTTGRLSKLIFKTSCTKWANRRMQCILSTLGKIIRLYLKKEHHLFSSGIQSIPSQQCAFVATKPFAFFASCQHSLGT